MDKEHLIMDIQSLRMDTNIDRTFDQIMSLLDKFSNTDLAPLQTQHNQEASKTWACSLSKLKQTEQCSVKSNKSWLL